MLSTEVSLSAFVIVSFKQIKILNHKFTNACLLYAVLMPKLIIIDWV